MDRVFLVLILAALAAVGAAVYDNVKGDNSQALETGAEVACGRAICDPKLISTDRQGTRQTQVYDIGKGLRVTVVCSRAYWLRGEWGCFVDSRDRRVRR